MEKLSIGDTFSMEKVSLSGHIFYGKSLSIRDTFSMENVSLKKTLFSMEKVSLKKTLFSIQKVSLKSLFVDHLFCSGYEQTRRNFFFIRTFLVLATNNTTNKELYIVFVLPNFLIYSTI